MNTPNLPMFPLRLIVGRLSFMNWIKDALNTVSGTLGALPISWVDFLTLLVVCVGVIRGRKRGLSEELLDTVQWIAIVVVGAYTYHLLADVMNRKPLLSLASYCVLSYLVVGLAISLVFMFLKKRFGQKLIEGDIFGRFEFYGGMGAGAVRWLCMYFALMSLLHAPQYSAEEIEARRKQVEYNFGSDFFGAFTICKIQPAVFQNSLTGRAAEAYARMLLIEPSSTDSKDLRGETSLAKRRERAVDDAMGGR